MYEIFICSIQNFFTTGNSQISKRTIGHLEKLLISGKAKEVETVQHMRLKVWYGCVTEFFEVRFGLV